MFYVVNQYDTRIYFTNGFIILRKAVPSAMEDCPYKLYVTSTSDLDEGELLAEYATLDEIDEVWQELKYRLEQTFDGINLPSSESMPIM